MLQSERVPEPSRLPLLQHLHHVKMSAPLQSMVELARQHGPLFRLEFPTGSMLLLGDHALTDEVCDEQRFRKAMHNVLLEARHIGGDGLFTAYDDEPNWALAHRILMPAFGALALRDMFPAMLELATQLVDRWERLGSSALHDVPDQMTRLTLDTIALCGFNFRFNSFYRDDQHPFVDAMLRSLREAGDRARRPPLQTRLMPWAQRNFANDIASMRVVVEQVIRERRESGQLDQGDLLSRMLLGRDPITGQALDDANISNQIVTFLIAGHETTSGLLSFALHALTQHPAVLAQARAEVDRVIGTDPGQLPRFEHLSQLVYLDQVLRETLRLWPTAPVFGMTPRQDTLLAGRYPVRAGENMLVLLPMVHRDPAVWGDDAERFAPERFAPGVREHIPTNAYKPFGTGARACIGRPFAMQEAVLVLALLLSRFELEAEPGYELRIKETLTLKPDNLRLRARPRTPRTVVGLSSVLPEAKPSTSDAAIGSAHHTPLCILFGSSGGTSEGLAQRLAQRGAREGYRASCAPMDAAVAKLPSEGAVILVCASYNGAPSHNARAFSGWLEGLPPDSLRQVRFAVFGCGHRDWSATYQAVPRKLDAMFESKGAGRVLQRGEGDAGGDLFGTFEAWSATLFADLARTFELPTVERSVPHAALEIRSEPCARLAHHRVQLATVTANDELIRGENAGRSKRHVELRLPDELTYQVGDYLRVLPRNAPEWVARAAHVLGLPLHGSVRTVEAGTVTEERPVQNLLEEGLELTAKAQPSHVALLARWARCPPEQHALAALQAPDTFAAKVTGRSLCILELLEQFPSSRPPLAELLALWPTLSTRRYSISSAPSHAEGHCSLTVSVLDQAALSGMGRHRGTASHYLARLRVGDLIPVAVEPGPAPFAPPSDATTPLILVCAGTGVAPFRGFVQERARQKSAGDALGRTLLYFGCDHPDIDLLYGEELRAAERAGLVELRATFCHAPREDQVFVQHRLWQERGELAALVEAGAHIRVCGDARVFAPAVKEVWQRILGDAGAGTPGFAELERSGRYVADVFT